VFAALRTTFALNRQLAERVMAEWGMHPSEAMCLRILAERNGVSQSDLAELLHLSRPRVTSILQDFEKSGIVERRTDEHDQRITRVFLTAEGRRLAQELGRVFAAVIGRTIGALSEADRRELIRLFGRLMTNIGEALQEVEHHTANIPRTNSDTTGGQTP